MDESPTKMYVLASTMLALATIPVILRFSVRTSQKQGLGLDDWLIVPALLGTIGTAAAMFDATILGGLGGHTEISHRGRPIFTPSTEIFLKANFVTQLTQTITFGFVKLSVLFFYRRLFSGKRYFNIASWVMLFIVTAWTIAFFFAQLYQCVPLETNWLGPNAPEDSYCVDELMMYIAGAYSDAITDALILALPLPIIWNLQMTVGRKVALSGVFLLGALTGLASIARLVVYNNIESHLNAGDRDMVYILAPTFYWPLIESALGILGACLPPLRPLYKGFSPETMLRSMRSRSRGTGSGISGSSGSGSRSAPISAEKRTWISAPSPIVTPTATLREALTVRRMAKDDDTWSFHSDAESFGYHAEVSAKGLSVKRAQDFV